MSRLIGALTGANSAKKAAAAQAQALEEQTRQAQKNAAEAARQASIQAAQAQQREAAVADVEAQQAADASASAAPEVETGVERESTARKRAKFQSKGRAITSLSI